MIITGRKRPFLPRNAILKHDFPSRYIMLIEIDYFSGDFPWEWHDENNNLLPMDFYDGDDSGVFSPLSSFAAALANEEEEQSFSENESAAAVLRDITNYYPHEQNPPGRRYEQSGMWESSENSHDSATIQSIQPLIEDVVMDENVIKLVFFPFWALFCPPPPPTMKFQSGFIEIQIFFHNGKLTSIGIVFRMNKTFFTHSKKGPFESLS